MSILPKYDEDFCGWVSNTAVLLKAGKYEEVEMDKVIEEIEALGRSERNQLESRLEQLLFHLLKWQFQPDFRSRSWSASIDEQRIKIKRVLQQNPGLTSELLLFIEDAYKGSFLLIKKETPIDLAILPKECPYTWEQIINDDFYPE